MLLLLVLLCSIHYVWFSWFWSHLFLLRGHSVSKKFQKTLNLAFQKNHDFSLWGKQCNCLNTHNGEKSESRIMKITHSAILIRCSSKSKTSIVNFNGVLHKVVMWRVYFGYYFKNLPNFLSEIIIQPSFDWDNLNHF